MNSRTKTALGLFAAVMVLAAVERVVRVVILAAFWPAIAFFAPIDPERTPGTGAVPQSAGLAAAGGILAAFLFVDLLLTSVGFHFLRSGRSEFGPHHSTRVAHSGIAMVLYLVLAFVGNIALAVTFRSFLPWLGYTFSLNPARYASFTLVNIGLAVLAGFAVLWMVEKLLDPRALTLAIGAFALGVGSAVAVAGIGLAVLAVTPLPAQPTDIPFAFAMAEVTGDALAGVSIILWLLVYLRTLGRFRRGELVAIPPPPVYSTPPPYIPPSPPIVP